MTSKIEPGLLRIFRFFTGIAMLYFAILVFFTAIETGKAYSASQIQSYMNFFTNLVLLGYLSWSWLDRKMGRWYLPLALVAATVVPLFSNLVYLAEPFENDLQQIIIRSWLLLPILLVPLVLTAWQYPYRFVMLFITFSTVVELSVLYPVVGHVDFETLPTLGSPLIRAFAFGTVGFIVSQLVNTQREQRRELVRANIKLGEHAGMMEELATSRERNRLAREFHDTLAHTLSGLAVNLEAIRLTIHPGQLDVERMLDEALNNTRAGLIETRRALKDLRSKQLEDLGLRLAVTKLAEDAASRSDCELRIKISDPLPEFSPQIEQVVYRITQEALENIVKHASAQLIEIQLFAEDGWLDLSINDDGVGFRSAKRDVDTLGIQGMQERASSVGGILRIETLPAKGTSLKFHCEVSHD